MPERVHDDAVPITGEGIRHGGVQGAATARSTNASVSGTYTTRDEWTQPSSGAFNPKSGISDDILQHGIADPELGVHEQTAWRIHP